MKSSLSHIYIFNFISNHPSNNHHLRYFKLLPAGNRRWLVGTEENLSDRDGKSSNLLASEKSSTSLVGIDVCCLPKEREHGGYLLSSADAWLRWVQPKSRYNSPHPTRLEREHQEVSQAECNFCDESNDDKEKDQDKESNQGRIRDWATNGQEKTAIIGSNLYRPNSSSVGFDWNRGETVRWGQQLIELATDRPPTSAAETAANGCVITLIEWPLLLLPIRKADAEWWERNSTQVGLWMNRFV